MRSNFLLFTFLLITSIGLSQNVDVSGNVVESGTGLPIPSVNIFAKDYKIGTSTDFDGNFTLKNVPVGVTLIFSYVGYLNYEYKVTKSEVIKITMLQDLKSLEEVVVIGYGTKAKKDVTGAVGYISTKTIDDLKPIKIEQALQGTLAGVDVSSNSGAPGAGLSIRIRGIQSNGNNDPLYIVDGNITNPSILNPSDIESITVLKDAQAAIYGVRGANGVVIIKTKQGKRNSKTIFSFNSYTGFQETTKKLNLLNATEYALLLNESYANGGQTIPFPNVSGLGEGTDWQDEVFGKGVLIQNNDINVSGGFDKINYALSGSHLKQDGLIGGDKSGFSRSTLMMSIGVDLTSKLKIESSVNYVFLDRRSINENGLGSVLFNAINTPSIISPYDANGNYTLVPSTPGYGIEVINPLAQIDNTYNSYNIKRISGAISADYKFNNDLSFTSRIGFNTSNSESKTFAKIVNYGGKVFDVARSSVSQNAINDNNYVMDLYFTYKKLFANNHNFTATLGTSNIKDWGNGLFATGFDVPNNSWDFADISLANGLATSKSTDSYAYDERLNSYFARLQYEYLGRYLLSGMIRRDSSTKFGPDNAVAYFPSATGGWIVSEEDFLQDSGKINFLKIRGSYGLLGNDKILNNGYLGLLNGEGVYVFNNQISSGVAPGLLPNPGLQWETARKFDVGLDIKLFNNMFDITTDYFIESRSDLLIGGLPVSGISGVGGPGGQPPVVNAGSTKNKGFEFSVTYNKAIGDDFKLSTNFNFTTIKNVVTKVSDSRGIIEAGTFGLDQRISRMEEGQSIGYFYGLEADGIFQNQAEVDAHPSQIGLGYAASPGDIRFKDINGDGKIDLNDRTNVGSPLPKFTLGYNLTLEYKNFDFVAYTYASVGNKMVRNYERTLTDVNRLNYVLGRWTGEGTSNDVPRVTTSATSNNLFSSYFVEDASFFRIQNVQLGYTLRNKIISDYGISKLRLYTTINNVHTFTKYRGFDPTQSNGAAIGGGIDYGAYPLPRIFILGLNLNF